MRVQHLKMTDPDAAYGPITSNICSGSHVFDLSDATAEKLAKTIVGQCEGEQGFLIVSPDQQAARRAINTLGRKGYRFEEGFNEYRFKVRRLGSWSGRTQMFLIAAVLTSLTG